MWGDGGVVGELGCARMKVIRGVVGEKSVFW